MDKVFESEEGLLQYLDVLIGRRRDGFVKNF